MNQFEGTATSDVAATPSDIFELITDFERLPDWNRCIASVLQAPTALEVGAQWTVQMHVPPIGRWKSISTVVEVDRDALRLVYTSKRVDNNPTDVLWQWQLTPIDGGTNIEVRWEGHPRTLVRKILAAPIRSRQLHDELKASLRAIADLAVTLPSP